jgi:hypothetical protein
MKTPLNCIFAAHSMQMDLVIELADRGHHSVCQLISTDISHVTNLQFCGSSSQYLSFFNFQLPVSHLLVCVG